MLRGFVKNIVAIGMAILVLFATLSFTINEHYCGSELQDVAWFVKADACMMDMDATAPSEDCAIVKDACCKDVVQLVEGRDDVQPTFHSFQAEQPLFVAAFFGVQTQTLAVETKEIPTLFHYRPPLLVRNIQLLDAVFLI